MTLGDVLLFGLLLVSLFLMFVILLQRGRGGGLAGAFGGLGGQSAFGTKAGDVFTVITVVTVVIWVILSCVAGARLRYEASPEFHFRGGAAVPPAAAGDGAAGKENDPGAKGNEDDGERDETADSGKAKAEPGKKVKSVKPADESTGAEKGKAKADPGTGSNEPAGDETPEKAPPDKD